MTLARWTFPITLALLALTTSACKRGESPTNVSNKFYEALATGDIETARAHATPETANLIDTLVSKGGSDGFDVDRTREVHDEVISGDSAVVSYRNDDGSIATVPLVKRDGVWRVDFSEVIRNATGGRARTPSPVSQ